MPNPVLDYPWDFANMNTPNTGVLVKTGRGVLHSITFNGMTTVGDVAVWDGVAAAGTLIATLYFRIAVQVSCQPITLFYDVEFTTGLFIDHDATATADLTVAYK